MNKAETEGGSVTVALPDWQPIETAPEKVAVETKIDDAHGPRNEAVLTRKGRLWFTDTADGVGMYVYYSPTHWRRCAGSALDSRSGRVGL